MTALTFCNLFFLRWENTNWLNLITKLIGFDSEGKVQI